MWAAKLPGEGAALYDACVAMCDVMAQLGIAVDGGKDSLSMAARVGSETVKAPGRFKDRMAPVLFFLFYCIYVSNKSSSLITCLIFRVPGDLGVCRVSGYYCHHHPGPEELWNGR